MLNFGPPLEYYAYSGLVNAVVSFAMAILVLSKKFRVRSARLYAYLSTLIGLWSLFYFLWLRTTQDLERADILIRTCMLFVILMPPVFLHFASLITGKLTIRWMHSANYLLSFALCPTVYFSFFTPGGSAYLVFPYWPLPGPTFWVHLTQITSSVGVGLWLLFSTARESIKEERTRFLWLFWSFAVGWLSGFTNYLMWLRIPVLPVLNAIVSLYVIALTYGIIRHQVLDIRIIIRRSLVYSLLIACITATYLVMVLVMEKWFQGFFGYRSFFATVLVAFLIALFFNPLRSCIQVLIDRALFRATPAELAEQREQLLIEVRKGDQMKAVATLAAGLAHEIKNPLASIKTFTEHLSQRYEDPVFRERFQKIVGGEVNRISHIVQQLLEFAKPVPLKLTPVEVPKLLDETLEFLNNEFLQRKVEVQKHYSTNSQVLADPQQLKQVFLNLLLNSLQAMNGHAKLQVSTAVRDGELSVTILDNGSGIAPQDLPRIFDPFFTTKPTGTGLGLAVVQGIIQEHGGRIRVVSQLGHGTKVDIQIPLTRNRCS